MRGILLRNAKWEDGGDGFLWWMLLGGIVTKGVGLGKGVSLPKEYSCHIANAGGRNAAVRRIEYDSSFCTSSPFPLVRNNLSVCPPKNMSEHWIL